MNILTDSYVLDNPHRASASIYCDRSESSDHRSNRCHMSYLFQCAYGLRSWHIAEHAFFALHRPHRLFCGRGDLSTAHEIKGRATP
jgi:hypothetical protein